MTFEFQKALSVIPSGVEESLIVITQPGNEQ